MQRKILAVVPSLLGNDGSAVNERQLLEYLCGYGKCYVISGVPSIKKMPSLIKDFKNMHLNFSFVLFLPVLSVPIILLFLSIILLPVIFLLDKIKKFNLIYVRTPLLSFGIFASSSLMKKTCVKLTGIFEDEIRSNLLAPSSILKIVDRVVLSKAAVVATPSPILLKRIAIRRRAAPRGKVVFVPAGVDEKKIETIRRINARLNRDRYLVGFVGTLNWWQGVDLLIRAVAKVSEKLKVTLLIVGDGPERKKIEKLCEELKVNCVITGYVRHEVALALLSNLDVLVVPSVNVITTESNIPIKIIEAWALGVPVVTSSHEIYKYLGLRDEEYLLYCEPEPSDIAEKILKILTNPELREKLARNGREIAKKFYYRNIVSRGIQTCDSFVMDSPGRRVLISSGF